MEESYAAFGLDPAEDDPTSIAYLNEYFGTILKPPRQGVGCGPGQDAKEKNFPFCSSQAY